MHIRLSEGACSNHVGVTNIGMVGPTAAMLARTLRSDSQSWESNSYTQPGRQLANKHHSNSMFLLPWFIVSIQHTPAHGTHYRIEAMALASWLVLWGAGRHVRLLRCLDYKWSKKARKKERWLQ